MAVVPPHPLCCGQAFKKGVRGWSHYKLDMAGALSHCNYFCINNYYTLVGGRGTEFLWDCDLGLHCNCCATILYDQTQIYGPGSQVTQVLHILCLLLRVRAQIYLCALSRLCFQQGTCKRGKVHPSPVTVRF